MTKQWLNKLKPTRIISDKYSSLMAYFLKILHKKHFFTFPVYNFTVYNCIQCDTVYISCVLLCITNHRVLCDAYLILIPDTVSDF